MKAIKQNKLLLSLFLTFITGFFLFMSPLVVKDTTGLSNGLANTPPMGWNTYYSFGCNPTESIVLGMADAMVNSGMRDVGYEYVVIDDCWSARSRDSSGNLVADKRKFPSGIKYVADYVHARGLKLGIYAGAGTKNCSGLPGSLGYEEQDVRQFASWGVDFIKVDWCATDGLDAKTTYTKWRDAIATTNRQMLLSICNWGEQSPWIWGAETGHMWRTYKDISWYKDTNQYKTADHWYDVLRNLDKNSAYSSFAGAGGWNDPDILQVGMGGQLNQVQERSHYSMWAMMASPLITGNDLRTMPSYVRDIFTNPEVIAINQDALGHQGIKVKDDEGLQVWVKKLSADGNRAVALFNRKSQAQTITINWDDIGLAADAATVRNLWERQDLGSFSGTYSANVGSNEVVLLKIQGTSSTTQKVHTLSSGPVHPASAVNDSSLGSISWTNVWDSNSDNEAYAYAVLKGGQATYYIKATSYPFGIPTNATVNGINADIKIKSAKGVVTDNRVSIVKNGVITTTNFADLINPWPTTGTYKSYGSSTNLWGLIWTPDEINADGFGIALSSRNPSKFNRFESDTSYVDTLKLKVYYTMPGI